MGTIGGTTGELEWVAALMMGLMPVAVEYSTITTSFLACPMCTG